jgi:outer membrane protein insertion porin family
MKSAVALILSILFYTFSFAQSESVKEYEIAAIKVDGSKNLDKNIIVALSGLRVGQTISYPGEDITKAIKSLWRQKLFGHIEINAVRFEGKKVHLRIRVEDKPRLSRYTIKGIKAGEIEDVRKKLDLRSGMILSNVVKSKVTRDIKKFFYEKGFIYTKVSFIESVDSIMQNSSVLTINVEKGEKIKIDNIYFKGNHNMTDRQVKKAMKNTKESAKADFKEMFRLRKNLLDTSIPISVHLSRLSGLALYEYVGEYINPNIFAGAKYDKEKLEEDKNSIVALYNSKGYRDAKIAWDTVYSPKSGRLDVVLKIDEGKLYHFRNISWLGNTKYADSTLSKILGIRKGDVYNQSRLQEKLNMSQAGDDVSSLYMDDGYLFFHTDPTELLADGDSIDLEMRMYEGPQAIINRINISGNEKTNEKVIRRELRILPGDKFDRSKLIRTQRELSALTYFNPQELQINPKPNPENGTVDIDIKVTEKPSDQLELSLGYGGASYGLYGTVGLNFTNFSIQNIFNKKAWSPLPTGDGQTLNLRIQANGIRSQFYSMSFTEPWLGGHKPTSLQVTLSRVQNNNVGDSSLISGSYFRTSASAELGSRLKWPDDFFTIFGGVTFENIYLQNYPGIFAYSTGNANNIYGKITIARNNLNGPIGPQIYPTTGANISWTIQGTLPYASIFASRRNLENTEPQNQFKFIEYYKTKFSVDWYTPIVGKLVFRASAKMGVMGTYSSGAALSPFERFEVGGDGIQYFNLYGKEVYGLRGYETNQVMGSIGTTGATIFNKYVMELRYPFSLNPQATIYGLIFAEGGNAYADAREFNPFNVKRSFGAGLRFFLPMFGLLGFDYGVGFDKVLPASDKSPFIDKYGKFRFILGIEPQ